LPLCEFSCTVFGFWGLEANGGNHCRDTVNAFAYIFADELAGVLRSRSVGIAVVEMSGLINILLLLSSFLRAKSCILRFV